MMRVELQAGGYDVELALGRPGYYTVTFSLRGETTGIAVRGASGDMYSVLVEAGPGLSGAASRAYGAGLGDGVAGEPATLSVWGRDVQGNAITGTGGRVHERRCAAHASPETAGVGTISLPCEVYSEEEGRYLVTRTLTVAGAYSMWVKLDGEAVAGAEGLGVTVGPGVADSSRSSASGAGLTDGRAGEQAEVEILVRDAYGNRRVEGGDVVMVTVDGGAADGSWREFVNAQVADHSDGSYTAVYTVARPGAYTVDAELGGVRIGNSPWAVALAAAKTDAGRSFARGAGAKAAAAGVVTDMTIVPVAITGLRQEAGDAAAGRRLQQEQEALDGEDVFDLTITPGGPGYGSLTTAEAESQGDGTYAVRYTAQRALYGPDGQPAPYQLAVRYRATDVQVAEHVAGSPFEVYVEAGSADPAMSATYSAATGAVLSAGAELAGAVAGGGGALLLLQTRDSQGNDVTPLGQVGGGLDASEVTCTLTGMTPENALAAEVEDLRDGRFWLSHNLTVAGGYEVEARLGGLRVGGLHSLVVTPAAADPRMLAVTGPGVDVEVLVDVTDAYEAWVRDAYGNHVADDGALVDSLRVTMQVRSGDAVAGTMRLSNPAEVAVIPRVDDSYLVRYTVTVSGTCVTRLAVAVGPGEEVEVGGSPFEVPSRASAAADAILAGHGVLGGALAMEAGGRTPFLGLHITPTDAQGNPTAPSSESEAADGGYTVAVAMASGGDVAAVEQPVAAGDGTFTARWSVGSVGIAVVEVRFQGELVGGSPVDVQVLSAYGDVLPAVSYAAGAGLVGAVAGTPAGAVVHLVTDRGLEWALSKDVPSLTSCEPRSGGADVLYVQAVLDDGPLRESNGNGEVRDNCDGTYTVTYTVQASGVHYLEVLLGPEPGNPNFGTFAAPIGDGIAFRVVAYAGNTTGMEVIYRGEAAEGWAYSGEAMLIDVYPMDAYGNYRDGVAAGATDIVEVSVLVRGLVYERAAVQQKADHATEPAVAYFAAVYVPGPVGEVIVEHWLGASLWAEEGLRLIGGGHAVEVLPGEPAPNTTEVHGEGLHLGYAGVRAGFTVLLRDAYGNHVSDPEPRGFSSAAGLTADLTWVTVEASPVLVEFKHVAEGGGVWRGNYLPIVAGLYVLNVQVGEMQVTLPSSYGGTSVRAGVVSAEACVASGAGVGDTGGKLPAGVWSEVTVEARDAHDNPVELEGEMGEGRALFEVAVVSGVTARDGTTVSDGRWRAAVAPLEWSGGAVYRGGFALQAAGIYLVNIAKARASVGGRAFAVEVVAGATSATHTGAYCEHACCCGLATTTAGMQSRFILQARDRYGNNKTDVDQDRFYFTAVGPKGFSRTGRAPARGFSNPGQYYVEWNCEAAGLVEVEVRLASEAALSALATVAPSDLDLPACRITGGGITEPAVAGEEALLAVTAQDVFGNEVPEVDLPWQLTMHAVDAAVATAESRYVELRVTHEGGGSYVARYTQTQSGAYELHLSLRQELQIVAATVDAAPPVTAATTVLLPDLVAGEPANVTIALADAYGNAPPGNSSARLLSTLGITVYSEAAAPEDVLPIAVKEENGDAGTYSVAVMGTLAGTLRLALQVGDDQVSDPSTGAPYYEGAVLPALPHPSSSAVYGDGAAAVGAGAEGVMYVRLFDHLGNPTRDDVAPSLRVSFGLADDAAGELAASVAILGAEVVYLGGGSQGGAARAGMYSVRYDAPAHDVPYTLRVTVHLGDEVVGMTQNVRVELAAGGASALMSGVLSTTLEPLAGTATATPYRTGSAGGAHAEVYVQVRDAAGLPTNAAAGWLQVAVTPAPSGLPEVLPAGEGADGSMWAVRFQAVRAGTYDVQLLGGGEPVGGGSGWLVVQVASGWPSDAAASELVCGVGATCAGGEVVNAAAGVPVTLRIEARDAYGNPQEYLADRAPEDVTASLLSMAADAEVTAAVTDNHDGTYDLRFSAEVAGQYDVAARLGGALLASPLMIDVAHGALAPPPASTIGNRLPDGIAGEFYQVLLSPRDAYDNLHTSGSLTLHMRVTMPSGGEACDEGGAAEVVATVMALGNGSYMGSFVPVAAGEYCVSATEASTGVTAMHPHMLVVQSAVPDATASRAAGAGLQGAVVGSVAVFRVSVTDRYTNPILQPAAHVLVNITLPSGGTGPPQALRHVGAGEVEVTYMLHIPGEHLIHVALRPAGGGGEALPLPGSPFAAAALLAPAPAVMAARLSESLASVELSFGSATDRGATLGSRAESSTGAPLDDCAALLASDSLSAMQGVGVDQGSSAGEGGARCVWVTAETLRVDMGPGAELLPGDTVALRGVGSGEVRGEGGGTAVVSGAAALSVEAGITMVPAVAAAAPTAVGPCDDLMVEAGGSLGGGGRGLQFEYGLEASTHSAAVLAREALAVAEVEAGGAGGGEMRVHSENLEAGAEFALTMRATDYLGQFGETRVTLTKRDEPVPRVVIQGGHLQAAHRAEPVRLVADVAFASTSCYALRGLAGELDEARLVFRWLQTAGPPLNRSDFPSETLHAASAASAATPALYLPPQTLRAGHVYAFRLTAHVAGAPAPYAAAATVELGAVMAAALLPRIAGGSRAVPASARLVVAAAAVDPDNADDLHGEATLFQYSWRCTAQGGGWETGSSGMEPAAEEPCFPVGQEPAAMAAGTQMVEVAAGALPPGAYTWTLSVSKEPLVARRVNESVAVRITLMEGVTQDVAVTVEAPGVHRVLPTEPLLLQEAAFKGLVGAGTPRKCNTKGSLNTPGALDAAAATDLREPWLVLRAGALAEGQRYTCRLQGTGAAAALYAEATFITAEAPWGGRFDVAPLALEELATPCHLRLTMWAAHPFNAPFTYEVRHVDLADEQGAAAEGGELPLEMPLVPRGPAHSIRAWLPRGQLRMVAYVYDAHGAVRRVEYPEVVSVRSPLGRRRGLLQWISGEVRSAEALADRIEEALAGGARVQAAQLMDVYGRAYGSSAGAVQPGCGQVFAAPAAVHEAVLQHAEPLFGYFPGSSSWRTQLVCAHRHLAGDARYLTANATALLLRALNRTLAAALSSEDGGGLDAGGARCTGDLLSHLLAVTASGCASQSAEADAAHVAALRSAADSLAEALAVGRPAGAPPRRVITAHLHLTAVVVSPGIGGSASLAAGAHSVALEFGMVAPGDAASYALAVMDFPDISPLPTAEPAYDANNVVSSIGSVLLTPVVAGTPTLRLMAAAFNSGYTANTVEGAPNAALSDPVVHFWSDVAPTTGWRAEGLVSSTVRTASVTSAYPQLPTTSTPFAAYVPSSMARPSSAVPEAPPPPCPYTAGGPIAPRDAPGPPVSEGANRSGGDVVESGVSSGESSSSAGDDSGADVAMLAGASVGALVLAGLVGLAVRRYWGVGGLIGTERIAAVSDVKQVDDARVFPSTAFPGGGGFAERDIFAGPSVVPPLGGNEAPAGNSAPGSTTFSMAGIVDEEAGNHEAAFVWEGAGRRDAWQEQRRLMRGADEDGVRGGIGGLSRHGVGAPVSSTTNRHRSPMPSATSRETAPTVGRHRVAAAGRASEVQCPQCWGSTTTGCEYGGTRVCTHRPVATINVDKVVLPQYQRHRS
ncbi:hypothetical protein CYMTET_15137 [Cymbomonas tetramitiformis]|uniref:PKD/REJ-like domain-containing protein n=1 Tax=Cymbomonas tetramitiformis TaxID=36881 RepID=A0AAE0GF67_9CHLO|nr:hypothetical protein CYMTET_15137 [Cymbomonas tetramitiformis]